MSRPEIPAIPAEIAGRSMEGIAEDVPADRISI
jgi:hypothetical protein